MNKKHLKYNIYMLLKEVREKILTEITINHDEITDKELETVSKITNLIDEMMHKI